MKYPGRNGEGDSWYSDKTGPLTCLMIVGHQLYYVHIDHLLQTEGVNCEEAFQEVVPEESSVQGQDRVHHRVHRRVLVFQRQLKTNDQFLNLQLVTLSQLKSLFLSPERFPVTVSELSVELQSQKQHQSETILQNTPVRPEHRYPARKRTPDGINL